MAPSRAPDTRRDRKPTDSEFLSSCSIGVNPQNPHFFPPLGEQGSIRAHLGTGRTGGSPPCSTDKAFILLQRRAGFSPGSQSFYHLKSFHGLKSSGCTHAKGHLSPGFMRAEANSTQAEVVLSKMLLRAEGPVSTGVHLSWGDTIPGPLIWPWRQHQISVCLHGLGHCCEMTIPGLQSRSWNQKRQESDFEKYPKKV